MTYSEVLKGDVLVSRSHITVPQTFLILDVRDPGREYKTTFTVLDLHTGRRLRLIESKTLVITAWDVLRSEDKCGK